MLLVGLRGFEGLPTRRIRRDICINVLVEIREAQHCALVEMSRVTRRAAENTKAAIARRVLPLPRQRQIDAGELGARVGEFGPCLSG
jgi:hypothetical protein